MMNFLLEATHTEAKVSWLKPVPADRAVTVGRRHHPAPDQPSDISSDWVIPFEGDTNISGRHFSLEVQGDRVSVQLFKDKAKLLHGQAYCETLALGPNESFRVGGHWFTIKMQEAAQPSYLSSLPVAELEKRTFSDPNHYMEAIKKLAGLELYDDNYQSRFLRMLGQAFEKHAGKGSIAIVELRSTYTDLEVPQAVVERWPTSAERPNFRPAKTLLIKATKDPLNAVCGGFRDQVGSLVQTVDWAVCKSIPQTANETRWGFYVDGVLPEGVNNDIYGAALKEVQHFISIAAGLFGNYRHCEYYRLQAEKLQPFVSPSLRRLLDDKRDLALNAAVHTITALIADIRGSCIIDESDETKLFNAQKQTEDVQTSITNAIAENGGIVGGLQGDAAMGFWGWPRQPDNHQTIERAIKALDIIRRTYRDRNHPVWGVGRPGHGMHFGMGLAHGEAIAGIMGVQEFRRIDLFGPVVNLAARLESLTKLLGVAIAVNEPIAMYVKERREADGTFTAREIDMGRYRLAGMTLPLRVFELLPEGLKPDTASSDKASYWEQLMKMIFDEKDWAAARELLEDVFIDHMHFGNLARALHQQIAQAKGKAPPGWEGYFDVDKANHIVKRTPDPAC